MPTLLAKYYIEVIYSTFSIFSASYVGSNYSSFLTLSSHAVPAVPAVPSLFILVLTPLTVGTLVT